MSCRLGIGRQNRECPLPIGRSHRVCATVLLERVGSLLMPDGDAGRTTLCSAPQRDGEGTVRGKAGIEIFVLRHRRSPIGAWMVEWPPN